MSLFETPTPEDRERLAADYRDRAEAVREHDWEPFETTWSTGQVEVVRAVLGQADSVTPACERLAYELWGIDGAERDAANGYSRTWAWIQDVARG